MAAPTPERIVIGQIVPTEFANETCNFAIHAVTSTLEDLRGAVDWKVLRSHMQETALWQRAHAWAEFARTGTTSTPDLLSAELKPYDEISTLVCDAVQGRLALQKNRPVTVAHLGAIAGLSKIHVGNLVREEKLPVIPDMTPYTVRAGVARDFLRARTVTGF